MAETVTDIVERLRLSYCGSTCVACEAAAEIERLENRIKQLQLKIDVYEDVIEKQYTMITSYRLPVQPYMVKRSDYDPNICPACQGHGGMPASGTGFSVCPECKGSGKR